MYGENSGTTPSPNLDDFLASFLIVIRYREVVWGGRRVGGAVLPARVAGICARPVLANIALSARGGAGKNVSSVRRTGGGSGGAVFSPEQLGITRASVRGEKKGNEKSSSAELSDNSSPS